MEELQRLHDPCCLWEAKCGEIKVAKYPLPSWGPQNGKHSVNGHRGPQRLNVVFAVKASNFSVVVGANSRFSHHKSEYQFCLQ